MVKSVAEQIREMGNRLSAINSLPKRSLTEITGVDPNTPSLWAKSKKGSVQLDDVAEVQKFLNDQGFDAGKVDGWYGRGTARAIQAFQKKYGLKVDGDAGTNTLSKMHEIANPQDPEDQQDTDGLDAMSNAPTDGRGTVNQPREVSRLLVGNLKNYVFKYSSEKAEELKDTHDVVFISDFGNRDRDNLLLLPMPSAMANKSALPTNTDGPLFSNQGIPLDQPGDAAGATTDTVGDAKKGASVDKIASTASNAIDAAGTTQSIVNDLKRFNELLDKLTKSPENAGTDFRHLISIVENTLLTEKLNAEEMAELKALYKKIQGAIGADPGLDTVINSALKRYTTSFPTPAAMTTAGGDPKPANNGGDGSIAVPRADPPKVPATNGGDGSIAVPRADKILGSTNNGITVQIPDNMRKELGLNEKTPKYAQLKLSPNGKAIYIRHDAAGKSSGPTIMFNSKEGKKIQKIVAAAGAKFIGGPAKPPAASNSGAKPPAASNSGAKPPAAKPPAAKPPAASNSGAKPPKGLAPPSQLPTNPTVSGNAAQKYINRTKQESLANDIINMMNEATFDTSTSLWRASGGGKRKLPAVKQMQQWLNNNGFDAGKADGWYGKGTARAVKAMQQAYGLSADGDAGPNTLSAMNKASPEPVDQDAEIAAMAAQTKGDLDQDDSVGAVGTAGAAAGVAGAAAGDPEPDQTVTTTAPVDSTDAGIDAATDNVNKSMAAGNVTGVQSDAEKAAADLKAKQDASSAATQAQFQKTKGDVSNKLKNAPDQTVKTVAPVDSTDAGIGAASDVISTAQSRGNVVGQDSDAEKAAAATRAAQDADAAATQAQFQKTKGDVSDKLSGAPDQTITTTGGAAANAGKAGNRGGVDTAIAAKTAELNKSAEQRKAEQLRRRQAKAALQRRSSASSSVQGRDDNVNTGAGVGTNSGNWKPKAGTVVRQSMYKESGIKFSGSIANAIAKLGKKR